MVKLLSWILLLGLLLVGGAYAFAQRSEAVKLAMQRTYLGDRVTMAARRLTASSAGICAYKSAGAVWRAYSSQGNAIATRKVIEWRACKGTAIGLVVARTAPSANPRFAAPGRVQMQANAPDPTTVWDRFGAAGTYTP